MKNTKHNEITTPARSVLVGEVREIVGLALFRLDNLEQLKSLDASFRVYDAQGIEYHISADLFNGVYPLSHTLAIRQSGIFWVATDFLLYRQSERHFFLTSADRLRVPKYPEPRGERITGLCRRIFVAEDRSIFSFN